MPPNRFVPELDENVEGGIPRTVKFKITKSMTTEVLMYLGGPPESFLRFQRSVVDIIMKRKLKNKFNKATTAANKFDLEGEVEKAEKSRTDATSYISEAYMTYENLLDESIREEW